MKKSSTTFVRMSRHSLKFVNTGKLDELSEFLGECRNAVRQYVDYLWDAKINWVCQKTDRKTQLKYDCQMTWDREIESYDLPNMLSSKDVPVVSNLSARALACAMDQAIGIVQTVVKKRKKDQNKAEWLRSKNYKINKYLQKRIRTPMTKPDCQNINIELRSLCVDIQENTQSKEFDLWIELASLYKKGWKPHGYSILLPVNKNRMSERWEHGKRLSGVLLNEKEIQIRYEIGKPTLKQVGETVGADQGIKTVLMLSNGKSTVDNNRDGYTLEKILKGMLRKRKGSKGYRRAQAHRKNFVNQQINAMDLHNIKEIKLEKLINLGFGVRISPYLRRFLNTLTRDKVEKTCEETGVQLSLQENEYNSQRCSECGWVQKKNRKGKVFKCCSCGFTTDADLNASMNVKVHDTFSILPFGFRGLKLNLKGFFWNSSGLFNSNGGELESPIPQQASISH